MKIFKKIKEKYNKLHLFFKVIIWYFLITGMMGGCSQTGWIGYYQIFPSDQENKIIGKSAINAAKVQFKNESAIYLELPKNCSGFILAGIITPFTPPIPIPNFRLLSFGEKNPCNYFTVGSSVDIKIYLMYDDKIHHPLAQFYPFGKKVNLIKYKFPIKAKNIDSGILIIEKNNEKIEVPFEYKYTKFYF